MNELLQKALVDIITKTTTGMETAISFLSSELPDVIYQLLMWKMIEDLIKLGLWMTLPLICLAVAWAFGKRRISLDPGPEPRVKDFPCKEKDLDSWGNPLAWIKAMDDWARKKSNSEEDRKTCSICSYIFLAGCALLAIIIIVNHLVWLQILISPKLYLIEYVAELGSKAVGK